MGPEPRRHEHANPADPLRDGGQWVMTCRGASKDRRNGARRGIGCVAVFGALSLVVSLFAGAPSTAFAASGVRTYVAHMSGDETVPAAETAAQGQAILRYGVDDGLQVRVVVANLEDVAGAHLHLAQPGSNGPVVIDLLDGTPIPAGSVTGVIVERTVRRQDLTGPLDGSDLADLTAAIEAGMVYVDVHTADFPTSEIRGQLVSRPDGGDLTEPFTYSIDNTLAPDPAAVPDSQRGVRPLAAVADEQGVVSTFVENEVILAPRSRGELRSFLRAYGGTIVESDRIPQPPESLGIVLTSEEMAPTEYTIRVDTSRVTLTTLEADAEAAGFGGDRTFSSESAARLMALMVGERRGGATVSPNYVFEPSGSMLFETEEHPDPKPTDPTKDNFDAFHWPALRFGNDAASSYSNVLKAWQFVAAHGIERRAEVAIIDSGFWIDGQGVPGSTRSDGISDFSFGTPVSQYDFDGEDYLAGGPNLAPCKNGGCPWHGNDSASIAAAIPDNGYGVAGTGGWVTDPMLFRTNFLRSQMAWAIRTATAWGADIISISSNNPCNLDCGLWLSNTFLATLDAQRGGVALVASAGNEGIDLDQAPSWPCSLPPIDGTPGTVCVGALDPGTIQRRPGTNYGSAVDIFAPTHLATTPNPSTTANNPPLAFGTGTSASAPFVAGVLAMMKAVNPTLTPSQLDAIVKGAARTNSSDPTVTRYLDAFAAVRAAAGGILPPDYLEPNDTVGTATLLEPGSYEGLTLSTDRDYYQLSLAEYSDVTIDVDYMAGLSTVRPVLIDTPGAAPPIGAPVVEVHPEGTVEGESRSWSLAPGSYVFEMKSGLNLYNLTLDANPTPLLPDVYEVNDTIGTAAAPAAGHHVANLHAASDVDHYQFTVPNLNTATQVFHFGVEFSEAPVELTLFKDGANLGTLPPSTSPSVDVSQPGTYIAADRRTRENPLRLLARPGSDRGSHRTRLPGTDRTVLVHRPHRRHRSLALRRTGSVRTTPGCLPG